MLPALVAAFVAFFQYAPTFAFGFVFDDLSLIGADGHPVSSGAIVPYRPVRYLSYLVDHALGGSAFVFHAHNGVLHAAVASLVAILATRFGATRAAATAAGLVVALHPLSVEAAAYVSGRRDLLSVAIGLAAVLAHVGGWKRSALALVVVASGAKESGLLFAAPIALLRLTDSSIRFHRIARSAAPFLFAVAAAAGLMLAYGAIGPWTPSFDAGGLSRPGRIALHYATGIAGLRVLGPEYPELQGTASGAAWMLVTFAMAAVTAWLVARSFRAGPFDRLAWIACAWTAVTAVAVCVWGGLHEPGADRHAYALLPPVAIALAVVASRGVIRRAMDAPLAAAVFASLCLWVLASLAIASRDQMSVWENERALWSHAVSAPHPSARAHVNYARALATGGEYKAAASHLRLALAADPDDSAPHLGMAAIQCAKLHPAKFRRDIALARERGAPTEAVDAITAECAGLMSIPAAMPFARIPKEAS